MEDKIRKVIREQIKKLKEYQGALSPQSNEWLKDQVNMYFEGGDEPGTPGEQGEFEITRIEQGDPQKYDDAHLAQKFLEELGGLGSIVVRFDDYIGDIKVTSDREGDAIVTWIWPGPVGEGMSDEEWADAKEAERLANHPEKDKINKIKKMMDKEKSLKEKATELGYLNENLPISLQQLEKEIKDLTGEYGSVSERKPGIYRIKFSHVRQELDGRVWGDLMKLIKSHPNDYEIVDAQNYYEANYDREEPAEQVPTIIFK